MRSGQAEGALVGLGGKHGSSRSGQLQRDHVRHNSKGRRRLVGAEGIEPPLLPCDSSALPMSYTPPQPCEEVPVRGDERSAALIVRDGLYIDIMAFVQPVGAS